MQGYWLLVLLLFWPAAGQAYRPFTGTDADVAGAGEIELEVGAFGWLHQGTRQALVAPALIANYGLLPRLELVLEGRQFVFIDAVPGESRVRLLDTALSVKFILREGALQEKSGPSVAIETSMLLPETGATRPGAEVAAIASQRWDRLTVHGNAAVALTRERHLSVFAGAIFEGPSHWPVRPVAEGFWERERGGTTEISGLGGGVLRLSEHLSIDAALRIARLQEGANTQSVWEVRAGLTWGFELVTSARR